MALFGKSKKDDKKDDKKIKPVPQVEEKALDVQVQDIKGNWLASQSGGSAGGRQVLKQFYISEKSTMLNARNQYVFKVTGEANKSEIKKQVEKVFEVKVKNVKVSNMPKKRRDLGRHPGFKAGFKKAVVVLKEGYSIEQAKA